MAERRMFARSVIDSDLFMDMPAQCQALYFHLAMQADDEGFINAPRRVLRMVGAGEAELQQLVERELVLVFDSGILAIRHWCIHNKIRADRRKGTVCSRERELVAVDDSGAYVMREAVQEENGEEVVDCKVGEDNGGRTQFAPTDSDDGAEVCRQDDNQMATKCQPSDRQEVDNGQTVDGQMAAQDRIGKERVGKVSIEEERGLTAQSVTAVRQMAASSVPEASSVAAPSSVPGASSQKEILDIFGAYNRICVGLMPCKKLTQSRTEAIGQVLTKWPKEQVVALLEKAQGTRFLQGDNERKWRAGFDWLMQPENLLKLEAGKYDYWGQEAVPTGGTGLGEAEIQAVKRMMEGY